MTTEKNPVRVVLEVDGYRARTVAFDGVLPAAAEQKKGRSSVWTAFRATSIGGATFVLAGWTRHLKDKRRALKRGDLIALVCHPQTPEFAVGIPVKFLRDLNEIRKMPVPPSADICSTAPPKPPVWVSNEGAGCFLGVPFPYADAYAATNLAQPAPAS